MGLTTLSLTTLPSIPAECGEPPSFHRLACVWLTWTAERDVETSTGGRPAAAGQDQEVDEVSSRETRGEQSTQGTTHHVAETQSRPRTH